MPMEAVYTSADIVNYHDVRPEEPGDAGARAAQSGAVT